MVLYKRKHVQSIPTPSPPDIRSNTEVWEITQTGEIFADYESYLKRRDFYSQRLFTCEITGHQGLTYFDALESEMQESRELDSTFPEPLRGPVLRKVQHSTTSRLEHLVNWIYDDFKRNFFPKERVIATLEGDGEEKAEGLVRDKTTFPARLRPDGSIDKSETSRYSIALDLDTKHKGRPTELQADGSNLSRDRRHWSKQILKSFLKNSLTKEAWHGAPWQVKEALVKLYHIPTEIPPHLRYDAVVAEKKAIAIQKKHLDGETKASFFDFLAMKQNPGQKGGKKDKSKGKNAKLQTHDFAVNHQAPNMDPNYQGMPQVMRLHPSPYQQQQPLFGHIMVNGHAAYPIMPMQHPVVNIPQRTMAPPPQATPPPPPPQIKYPTEDLDVPPRRDENRRPSLQFFAGDLPSSVGKPESHPDNGLKMRSMGPLLDLWNTLNVHTEVYILDSFTFDDFAEAMSFKSDEIECELLNEVFCATLKHIVNTKGDILVSLPEFEEEESEEEEEQEEEEEDDEEEPEPERRTTRSSFAKANEIKRSPTPEVKKMHQAQELLAGRDWVEMLKDRDFKEGNWQFIVVGVLYQLSLDERRTARCDKLLDQLVPLDEEVSLESVSGNFKMLDANDRIEILDTLVKLTISTKAIREQLEKMTEEMTRLRKKKIGEQSSRKALIKDLHALDEERKPLLVATKGSAVAADISEIQLEDKSTITILDSEDENGSSDGGARILRRGGERASDRKRKREEEAERKRKTKKPAPAKLTKEEMALKKVNEKIELAKEGIREAEDAIADCNNDLRETDCQRTKCLGRDRFCNRYYWFERNGMPFGGLPNTSTSHYGYANGRIWVQGPDAMERDGFLDLPENEQMQYKELHGLTVLERKKQEEGETHLNDAEQWAYYDTPEQLDSLIKWLDDRGNREKPLRKELETWRDVMAEYMKKMQAHLDGVSSSKQPANGGDTEMTNGGGIGTRISTRTKTYVDLESTQWKCLAWHNSQAVAELGQLHSEGLVKTRAAKKKGVAEKKEKIPLGKDGKLVAASVGVATRTTRGRR